VTVRDAELYTVAPDEVAVTFVSDGDEPVTTAVGDREVTTEGPFHHARVTGLEPGATYALAVDGAAPSTRLPATVTTPPTPSGRLRAVFATVNDVHFGETECGILELPGVPSEPVLRAEPGDPPYPEVTNRAAVAEMGACSPDAVVVKGDLTARGRDEEYEAFLGVYGALGERMHHVRGNHDALVSGSIADHGPFQVDLDGVTLAVLDTVRPGIHTGGLDADEASWLDAVASDSTAPVLVLGHHHPWPVGSAQRSPDYFGIHPDGSEALCDVVARREAIAGYFAGHTHRNRVRRFAAARDVPMVEVACVKDYPGAWAEYRVYDGGYVQVGRRIAAPAAMAWTEKTRGMFGGLYPDYALGALADRCFTQPF
jgi:Icc protein